MKRIIFTFVLLSSLSWAAPLSNTARSCIPMDVQQIIVVDYRSMLNFPTALALKDKVMPEPLKEFERALKSVGIDPEHDVEQLVFATYRQREGLKLMGVAQGQFAGDKLTARMVKQKIKGKKYRTFIIYPMGNGLSMVMVDSINMVFGFDEVVKTSLDVYDGYQGRSLNANTKVTDMIGGVHADTIWSVLDPTGTQVMLKTALGDAAEVADFESVKKRVQGSRWGMTFNNGVLLDLRVASSDSMSAGALATLIKVGVSIRKSAGSASEKAALEGVTVSSDAKDLRLVFKADDSKFKDLLSTELFAAVSK